MDDKPDLKRLESWLSRAEQTSTDINEPLADLFSLFNLEYPSNKTPPVAAVTAAYDGLAASEGWWLRADPVYLQPDRHQAVLVASEALELQAEESAALLETINAHFTADGLRLQAPYPQRWYLQLQEADGIQTTPLPEVMGQGVNEHLPQGKHRQQWHGWLNELQMLLHQHPVNQRRMQAGKLPVNSVWLWGEGRLPADGSANFDRVYGNDILLEALAHLVNIRHAPLSSFNPDNSSGRCLVMSNICYNSVKEKDVFSWMSCIEAIQNQYLQPLQVFLQQHADCKITLLPSSGRRYQMTRQRLPRWWHRRHSLETFLSV